jgi:hypothetical protein
MELELAPFSVAGVFASVEKDVELSALWIVMMGLAKARFAHRCRLNAARRRPGLRGPRSACDATCCGSNHRATQVPTMGEAKHAFARLLRTVPRACECFRVLASCCHRVPAVADGRIRQC